MTPRRGEGSAGFAAPDRPAPVRDARDADPGRALEATAAAGSLGWAALSTPHASAPGSALSWTDAGEDGPPQGPATDGARYERIALLGEGGMGAVWLGHDRVLDRRVAIKIPGQDAARIRLLEREARITARLDHPGIVAVFDMSEIEGWPCFVMPHIEGSALAELVRTGELARWTLPERVRLIADAADAVASAHRRGIVHHDLSPGNLLVDREGRARVIDWGLATPCGPAPEDRGPRGGTPGYTAPEVSLPVPAAPTLDVWSFGAILAMVAAVPSPDAARRREHPPGEPPTTRLPRPETQHSAALLGGPTTGETIPPAPAGLPRDLAARHPDLDAIVARCLRSEPSQRFPDAGALHEALDAWLARRVAKRARSGAGRRRLYGVAAAGVLAGLVVAAVLVQQRPPTDPIAPDPGPAFAADGNRAVAAGEQLLAGGASGEAFAIALDAMRDEGARVNARGLAFNALAQPRPPVRETLFDKPCAEATPHSDGRHVVCQVGPRVELRVDGTSAWSARVDAREMRVTDRHVLVVTGARKLLALDRGHGRPVAVDPRPGSFAGRATTWRLSPDRTLLLPPLAGPPSGGSAPVGTVLPLPWTVPCASGAIAAQDIGEQVLVSCGEGGAWWLSPGGEAERIPYERRVRIESLGSARSADGSRPVGGTRDGRVVALDGSGDSFHLGEPVVDLRPGPASGHILAHGARGTLRWIDLDTGTVLADLGRRRGQLADSLDRLALAHEDGLLLWSLPERLPRGVFRTRHGLASLAISADGYAVATDGAGQLTGLHLPTGAPLTPARWGSGVGMGIVWNAADDAFWAIGAGSGGPFRVGLDGHTIVAGPPLPVPGDFRQVLPLPDGRLALLGYHYGVLAVARSDGATELWPMHPDAQARADVTHGARSPDGTAFGWAANTGLWHQTPPAPPRRIRAGHGWTAIAIDAHGRITAARGDRILVVEPEGALVAAATAPAPVSSIAAIPGLALVATGDLEGRITLRDAASLDPVASWRLHRDRVSALAVGPGEAFLASVSWDGALRVLPLDAVARWRTTGDPGLRDALQAALETGATGAAAPDR